MTCFFGARCATCVLRCSALLSLVAIAAGGEITVVMLLEGSGIVMIFGLTTSFEIVAEARTPEEEMAVVLAPAGMRKSRARGFSATDLCQLMRVASTAEPKGPERNR